MDALNGTGRAVFGLESADDVAALLDRYLLEYLTVGVSEVLFRAGRIDVVWAVRTTRGQDVVVKAHRSPVDLTAREATTTPNECCPRPASPAPSRSAARTSTRGWCSAARRG